MPSRLGALRAPKSTIGGHHHHHIPVISDPFYAGGRPALFSKNSDASTRLSMATHGQDANAQVAQVTNRDHTWRPADGLVFTASQLKVPADRRLTKNSGSANRSRPFQTTTASGSHDSIRSLHGSGSSAVDQSRSDAHKENDSIASKFTALSLESSHASSLSYFMTQETHSEAKRNNWYWRYSFYKNSDGEKPKLHYCRKVDRSEEIARLFLHEKVIGFDIEWSPRTFYRSFKGNESIASVKENVSVIQLASESRIAVFQLALHSGSTAEELLAPSLKRIMESHDIAKVGVSINSDCTRIGKFLGTFVNSRVELSHIHNLVSHFKTDPSKINRKAVALHTLVQEHLGLPLCKDEVRTSNWDRELDIHQLHYAASDAYAGLQLYHVLNDKRLALEPVPPLPEYAELKRPIRLVDDSVDDDGNPIIIANIDEDYNP